MTFEKILIANRGEIACRIIKTAKKMQIKTVAVYSKIDENAKHVQSADEAVCIGEAPANQSYLCIDNIIKAALEKNVKAIHPGYGFLSENSQFAQKVQENNIAFIGPNKKAIEIMGDKIISKKYAKNANVNIIPGYDGEITDIEQAIKIADEIGYPVMIKAAAGGGGKGMRVVQEKKYIAEAYIRAMSEAKSSFNDGRILIEKYINAPRHIEIQILGDKFGNIIHLFERECSIQRRNQKIVEEAPSPFLDQKTRTNMTQQAIKIARKVNYDSAGTVEFIVDQNKNFYFLEMNTRLQVEHSVTEMITGVDIVEQMIKIAAKQAINLKQEQIKINGSAIEARIYCEDPFRDFLPASGRIKYYFMPKNEDLQSDATLRIDDGVYQGADVPIFYDPMIAKISVHTKNRRNTIKNMLNALNHCHIEGVENNVPFLAAIMQNQKFIHADINTQFIQQEFPHGFKGVELNAADNMKVALIATYLDFIHNRRRFEIKGRIMPVKFCPHRVAVFEDRTEIPFYTEIVKDNIVDFSTQDKRFTIETKWKPGQIFFDGKIDGKNISAIVKKTKTDFYQIRFNGAIKNIWVYSKKEAEYARIMPQIKQKQHDKTNIKCPMPGIILDILVKEKQIIRQNEPICTIEAMKMENVIRAEFKAIVKEIKCKAGDKISRDEIIVTLEEAKD